MVFILPYLVIQHFEEVDIMLYQCGNKFYKKLRSGDGRFQGMYLWQEVKKFLFFTIPTNNIFWLDDMDFIKCNKRG